jgi:RNA polymerase sigma-70 factor (ECF subfamily)
VLAFTENASEEARPGGAIDFTELYRRNATPIFNYLYSRVRNVADAQDLTSQTFVSALENLSRLHDLQKFTPWVFTIARNKAFDFFRKSQRRPMADFDEELINRRPRVRLSPRQTRTACVSWNA